MKKLSLLLYGLSFQMALFAQYSIQPEHYDSLTQELKQAKTDTARHDLLFQRGFANEFVDTKQAQADFRAALRISRAIGDEDRVLADLLTLGYKYSLTGEPIKAIHLLQDVTKGHGGTLEVISTLEIGSEFIIQLPN
jgi:hypothetical protein